MKIETKRLVLRPLKMSDAENIVKNINDLEVSKWLLVVPYPYKLKDAKDWIKKSISEWRKKNKESYNFGIELRETKKVIGCIGINKKRDYKGSVGYWIGEKYWKKGYGCEALDGIIKFAFNELKLKRLEAGVLAGNPSSGRLLEKFGFKKEGFAKKSEICKADRKIKDEFMYGLLKEDWKKVRSKVIKDLNQKIKKLENKK